MNVQISPLSPADVPATVALVSTALPVEAISPEKFARYVLLDGSFDAGAALVAKVGPTVAGFVYGPARTPGIDAEDARRGYITLLAVDERFRRQGLATRLVESAERSLRARGRSVALVSPYGPAYFTPGIDVAAYPHAVALFAKLGYTEVYRPISMRVDLAAVVEPPWVHDKRRALTTAGGKVETYRVEFTRPILDFARREFGIDWHDVYRQTMLEIVRGSASPGRISVAHCDGTVLGISHFDGERFGPIGVAASARSRGIGHLLMFETLRQQASTGHRAAWFLWSDDRTARRLYDAAGFTEARRFVVMKRPLA